MIHSPFPGRRSLWAALTLSSALAVSGLSTSGALAVDPIPVKPPPAKADKDKGQKTGGPGLGRQTRGRDRRLDAKQTEKSLKESIRNQEQILELEDKSSPSFAKHSMALADFYWDLAEFYGNRVNSEEIEKPLFEAQQRNDTKQIERWTREQQRLTDLKRKYQEETIKRYKDLTRRFSKAENLDEIRYFLAYNLTEMGRGEEGIEEYTKIIGEHPTSPFVPDALVNIGDYYFELNDFGNAIKLFEKAETYTEANIYGYSIYKQAWCLYNLADYKLSLQRFIDVIELAKAKVLEGQKGAIALRREAQNELVLPYSKVGRPADAIRFLIEKADAGDRYLDIASRLATIYTEQSEFARSTELLRILMDEARKGAIGGEDQSYKVILFQRQIVSNAIAAGDKKGTVDEIGNLIRIYETDMARAPADFQETERDEIKRMMLEVAGTYHAEYNKTKEKRTLEFTQRLYDEYLRVFRQDENAYQLSMNNALLMLATDKYEEAAVEFEKLIQMDPSGKYADLAAEQAVLAYLKVVEAKNKQEATKLKNEAEEDLKPIELPPEDKRFATAVDRWMAIVAKNGENAETKNNIPAARFASAKLYYNYNHFGEAAARFGTFLDKHPGHPAENDARRLLLSAYNLAGDIDNLRLYANKFDTASNVSEDLRADIQRVKNAFNFQECQKIQADHQHIQAATCFEKYAREFPDESRSVDAIYNAALAYFEAKQVVKALETQRTIIDKYPKHELAPKAAYAIGEMFRQTAAYGEASTWYEFLVQRYPDHKLAQNALRYAAIFRKTLGQYKQAIANLQTYLRKYPNEGDAPRVDFDIVLILEKEEKWAQVVTAVNAHLKKYQKEPATVRLQALNKRGLALQRMKKHREATAAFEQTLATFRGLEDKYKMDLDVPAFSAVAESHFNIGEVQLQEARAIKLDGKTDKTVTKAVTDKLTIMDRVKNTYEQVIAYGHPGWVIAASTQLGLAYQDLADAIENVPLPASVRGFAEAEDAFRQDMADRSTKIRAQALTNYRRALETAQRDRWFNEYSEKAERAIAQLDLEDKSVKEFRLRPTQLRPNGGVPEFAGGEAPTGDFAEALKIARDPKLLATRAGDAERLFRAAARDAKNGKHASYNVGLLLGLKGDLAGARAAWQSALGVDPKYNPARAQLLGLDLLDAGKAAGAVAELEKIAAEDPFQQDAQNLLTAWKLERATELMRTDKKKAAEAFEGARRHGRNVLAGDPDNIHAYLNIAITYYREGLFDQAGLVAESALEGHKEAAALHNVLGLVHLSRDNLRAATDAFLAALAADPANDDARLNLASIELGYGNFEAALKRFDEVLKTRPGDADVLMSRAVALRGLGRYDDAEKGYLAALAARPGTNEADYNLCILHQQYTQKYELAKSRCESFLGRIDKSNPKFAEVGKRIKSIEATMRALKKTGP